MAKKARKAAKPRKQPRKRTRKEEALRGVCGFCGEEGIQAITYLCKNGHSWSAPKP